MIPWVPYNKRLTAQWTLFKILNHLYVTEAEFKKKYLGLKAPSAGHSAVWPDAKIPQGSFPENFDWRDHGAVTPVKNQVSYLACIHTPSTIEI